MKLIAILTLSNLAVWCFAGQQQSHIQGIRKVGSSPLREDQNRDTLVDSLNNLSISQQESPESNLSDKSQDQDFVWRLLATNYRPSIQQLRLLTNFTGINHIAFETMQFCEGNKHRFVTLYCDVMIHRIKLVKLIGMLSPNGLDQQQVSAAVAKGKFTILLNRGKWCEYYQEIAQKLIEQLKYCLLSKQGQKRKYVNAIELLAAVPYNGLPSDIKRAQSALWGVTAVVCHERYEGKLVLLREIEIQVKLVESSCIVVIDKYSETVIPFKVQQKWSEKKVEFKTQLKLNFDVLVESMCQQVQIGEDIAQQLQKASYISFKSEPLQFPYQLDFFQKVSEFDGKKITVVEFLNSPTRYIYQPPTNDAQSWMVKAIQTCSQLYLNIIIAKNQVEFNENVRALSAGLQFQYYSQGIFDPQPQFVLIKDQEALNLTCLAILKQQKPVYLLKLRFLEIVVEPFDILVKTLQLLKDAYQVWHIHIYVEVSGGVDQQLTQVQKLTLNEQLIKMAQVRSVTYETSNTFSTTLQRFGVPYEMKQTDDFYSDYGVQKVQKKHRRF